MSLSIDSVWPTTEFCHTHLLCRDIEVTRSYEQAEVWSVCFWLILPPEQSLQLECLDTSNILWVQLSENSSSFPHLCQYTCCGEVQTRLFLFSHQCISYFTPLLSAVVSPAQASGGAITELENTEAAQRGATGKVGGGATSRQTGAPGQNPFTWRKGQYIDMVYNIYWLI